MKVSFHAFLILITILSVACSTVNPSVATPNVVNPDEVMQPTFTASLALSPTVSAPEPTDTPVPEPTLFLPVGNGISVPVLRTALNPLTLSMVKPLARWDDGAVRSVAWSPSGDYLAVATDIGVYVYRPLTLERLYFYATENPVESVMFLPDGHSLAFIARNVYLLETNSGKPLWIKSLEKPLAGLAFDTDQSAVAVLFREGKGLYIDRWKSQDGLELPQVKIDEQFGQQMALSPDARLVVDAAKGLISNTMRVWSAVDGKELFKKSISMNTDITGFHFSPDGKKMLVQSITQKPATDVAVWDMTRFMTMGSLRLKEPPGTAAFSPDNNRLVFTFSQEAQIWNSNNFRREEVLSSKNQFSTAGTAFSPDGRMLATGGLEIWDLTKKELLAYQDHAVRWNFAFSPDNQTFAHAGGPGILIRKLDDASLLESLPILDGGITNLEYSPDGTRLAASTDEGKVYLWNTKDWTSVAELNGSSASTYSLSFSADNVYLSASFMNGSIKLWNAAIGKEERAWKSSSGTIATVGFSPDGSLVEVNQKDMNFWKLPKKELLRSFKGSAEFGRSLSFSSDGSTMALMTGSVQTYNTQNGMGVKCSINETDWPTSVILTPDGKFLAAAMQNGSIYIMGVSSCQVFFSLNNQLPANLKISPDGSLLLTASGGIIKVWGVPK